MRRRIDPFRSAGDVRRAASELQDSLSFVYLTGRRNSRAIAVAETEAEIALLRSELGGLTGDSVAIGRASASANEIDAWRGRRAARGYAEHWLDDAEVFGPGHAVRSQAWRAEMGAITESSQAFTLARDQALLEFVQTQPYAALQLFKVWDATLDRRTCSICSGMHGVVVPVNDEFPAGRPGGVHPRCRCTFQILTIDEVDLDYLPDGYSARQVEQRAAAVTPASTAEDRANSAAARAEHNREAARAAELRKQQQLEQAAKAKAEAEAADKARKAAVDAERKARLAAEQKAAQQARIAAERRAAAEAKARLAAEKKAAEEAAKRSAEAKAAEAPAAAKRGPVSGLIDEQVASAQKRLDAANRMVQRIESGDVPKYLVGAEQETIARQRGVIQSAEADIARLERARSAQATRIVDSFDTATDVRVLSSEQAAAVKDFTGSSYTAIRKMQDPAYAARNPDLVEFADKGRALEQAIANNVQFRGELYRGIVVEHDVADQLLNAREVTWLGKTTSTSTSQSLATNSFATPETDDAVGIVFRIRNGRGMPVADMGIPEEREVLQSGASRFRVLGKQQDESGRWLVDVEQLD